MKKPKIIIGIIIIAIMLMLLVWGNNSIVVTNIKYNNSKIPSEFNGYRILQVSDVHNKQFGKNQSKLVDKIKKCNPDIIVITGDLLDDAKYDVDKALGITIEFINSITEIAPVYYVSGNHELMTGEYEKIKQELTKANVTVLDNDKVVLSKNEQSINLLGLLDPAFYYKYYGYPLETRISKLESELQELSNGDDSFKILLSHRPELMDIYAKNNIDVVLAGHAHGGQIRIPFIGAITAPNQGWFPKYSDGEYRENNTTMIVSRGLGASVVPIRVFNRPELILLELGK